MDLAGVLQFVFDFLQDGMYMHTNNLASFRIAEYYLSSGHFSSNCVLVVLATEQTVTSYAVLKPVQVNRISRSEFISPFAPPRRPTFPLLSSISNVDNFVRYVFFTPHARSIFHSGIKQNWRRHVTFDRVTNEQAKNVGSHCIMKQKTLQT